MARQITIEQVTVVLLVRENLGKILGQLVTNWGAFPAKIVVIDEVEPARSIATIGNLAGFACRSMG
jgi:hypothetical protein